MIFVCCLEFDCCLLFVVFVWWILWLLSYVWIVFVSLCCLYILGILVYCVFCGLCMCCGFLVVALRAGCLFGWVWIVGLDCLFADFVCFCWFVYSLTILLGGVMWDFWLGV